MKEIKRGKQFKKDLKKFANQPKKLMELCYFIDIYLRTGATIPDKYHAHMLHCDYAGHMECHMIPGSHDFVKLSGLVLSEEIV